MKNLKVLKDTYMYLLNGTVHVYFHFTDGIIHNWQFMFKAIYLLACCVKIVDK